MWSDSGLCALLACSLGVLVLVESWQELTLVFVPSMNVNFVALVINGMFLNS